ncbi:outer membrane efflux protein [Hymenobacter roseosalivarius DSM 11622]|uniref:Outer membrane efflux protein n=1 Tax=Hymenobacter roseosalivarius DSM 11622 TaxID=645990 RepID=A0A1W1UY12_9BACT|nr:TolC family protein [Hymenobacter roseosalivarius]SMB85982.1 outer membrane efflux protein [Hymenobacter roseosalivarius DSM 11622]
MKNSLRLVLLALVLSFLGLHQLLAQTPATGQPVASSGPLALSLQQAIDYAIQNKSTLQASRLNEQKATAQVGEIRSQGLPQVNVGGTVTNNFKLQRQLVDFGRFAGGPGTLNGTTLTPEQLRDVQAGNAVTLPPAYTQVESAGPQPFAFGLQYQGNASASVSQLLFDGSYLLGLKAANVFRQLSVKQTAQSEIEVVEQVSKAYYSTLVAREQLALLARNVERLDTLLYQTRRTFEEGFVEKLDVDRLQVQRNNLRIEQQNAGRLVDLGVALLKFQMGLDQLQPVQLTDSLNAALVDANRLKLQSAGDEFDYGQRIEYSVLQTQRDLAVLDIRNRRAGYLPRLSLVGAYGFIGSDPRLGGLLEFRGPDSYTNLNGRQVLNQNWFGFGNVGLSLQVPIFDGLRKKYSIQQARLTLETVNKGFTTLQQSIDLQRRQGETNLQNALDVLANQKANLALATDVARVSRIKFQEGVGSNLEVITAETDLRQSQTNYYSSLYEALVAKVDFDKAAGTLYQSKK